MKTGHTQASGYSLVASAKRPNGSGERRLISVVLGTTSDHARAQESQKLLNWGFQNFDTVKLYAKGAPVATPEIWKGTQNQIKIGFNHDVYVTVPRGMADKMKPVLERQRSAGGAGRRKQQGRHAEDGRRRQDAGRVSAAGAGAGEPGQHFRPRLGLDPVVDEISPTRSTSSAETAPMAPFSIPYLHHRRPAPVQKWLVFISQESSCTTRWSI